MDVAAHASDGRPIRVALVHDDEIVTAGLSTMLAPYGDAIRVVHLTDGAANGDGDGDGDAGIDVALIDTFRRDNGADGSVARVNELASHPSIRHVALFTFRPDVRAQHTALDLGLHGCLNKAASAPDLVAALRRVAAGETITPNGDGDGDGDGEVGPEPDATSPLARRFHLTEREADVLTLLVEGRRNGEIAAELGISRNTVKTHLRAVFRKLRVETRAQAVATVLREAGLVTSPRYVAQPGGQDPVAPARQ